MNSDVMPSVVQMEYEELQELLKEVKETVADRIELTAIKTRSSFGAVDMWNIRRNAKTAASMVRG